MCPHHQLMRALSRAWYTRQYSPWKRCFPLRRRIAVFARESPWGGGGLNSGDDVMKNGSYSEKLKDPRWQRKRLEIFNRDGWTCVSCGRADLELHVHHTRYIPYRAPWEYGRELLQTLCNKCHTKLHCLESAFGIVACWTLEESNQEECPSAFPWTGKINDRGPRSEIDPDYECIGSDGDPIWINASCGNPIKKPDGLSGLKLLDWVKAKMDELNRSIHP